MKSRHCRFCGSVLPSNSKITKLYCNTACRRQFWSARGVPDNILKPAVESIVKELLPDLVQAELAKSLAQSAALVTDLLVAGGLGPAEAHNLSPVGSIPTPATNSLPDLVAAEVRNQLER